jgi:hypothetical protein
MLSQASTSTSTTTSSPSSASALLERKIEECTAGLKPSVTKQLFSVGENNAATIVKDTEVMRTEVSASNHYRRDLILYHIDYRYSFTRGLSERDNVIATDYSSC